MGRFDRTRGRTRDHMECRIRNLRFRCARRSLADSISAQWRRTKAQCLRANAQCAVADRRGGRVFRCSVFQVGRQAPSARLDQISDYLLFDRLRHVTDAALPAPLDGCS